MCQSPFVVAPAKIAVVSRGLGLVGSTRVPVHRAHLPVHMPRVRLGRLAAREGGSGRGWVSPAAGGLDAQAGSLGPAKCLQSLLTPPGEVPALKAGVLPPCSSPGAAAAGPWVLCGSRRPGQPHVGGDSAEGIRSWRPQQWLLHFERGPFSWEGDGGWTWGSNESRGPELPDTRQAGREGSPGGHRTPRVKVTRKVTVMVGPSSPRVRVTRSHTLDWTLLGAAWGQSRRERALLSPK